MDGRTDGSVSISLCNFLGEEIKKNVACQPYQIDVKEYRRGNTNGQFRESGNIGYTRRRKTKQKYNTISVAH